MGTRFVLLAAAAVCLIPAVASAQAVPPRDFVGPPVALAGSNPAAPAAAAGTPFILPSTPTIGPPGSAVPPPRVVAPNSGSVAEKVNMGGATGALLEAGASKLTRYSDTLDGAEIASDMAKSGNALGVVAPIVGTGAALVVVNEKCTPESGLTAECAQAGLSFGSSAASALDLIPGGPAGPIPAVTSLAKGAAVLDFGANLAGAYNSCYASDRDDWAQKAAECVQSLADTGVSAGSNLPGAGKVISATYTVAKVIAPAVVDQGGTWLLGKSPGEWLYDRFRAADDDARIAAQAASPAMLERIRARRRAAYAQAAGELMSKQATYEAEEARKQSDALAASQRLNNSSGGVDFANAFLASLPGVVAPPSSQGLPVIDINPNWCQPWMTCVRNGKLYTPSSAPTPTPAPSPKPPSSDGGCGGTGPGTCR